MITIENDLKLLKLDFLIFFDYFKIKFHPNFFEKFFVKKMLCVTNINRLFSGFLLSLLPIL